MKIKAPLTGVLVPLHQVNDEVFSQKMVGDGIAIDPASQILLSPVDGVVSFIHPCKHAISIRPIEQPDVEILIHIGIDTVQMKGLGFKSFVKDGDTVHSGQKLIEFDLNEIIQKAKSPHTLILITNIVEGSENYSLELAPSTAGFVHALSDDLFTVLQKSQRVDSAPAHSSEVFKKSMTCRITSGVHARPASLISKISLKNFDGAVEIIKDSKTSNAKSLTSIMSLSISYNDQIQVVAYGAQAQKIVTEIETVLTQSQPEQTLDLSQGPVFSGITVSPGDNFGKTYVFKKNDLRVSESQATGFNPEAETVRIKHSVAQAKISIEKMISQLTPLDSEKSSIYQAHLELLNDPEILNLALNQVKLNSSAEYSWQLAIDQTMKILKSLKNEMLAERSHDVNDIGQKVLRHLMNKDISETSKLALSGPTLLIARNLVPSDMSLLDSKVIKGLILVEGGASSHVAIIARSMGIPSITAVNESVLLIKDQTPAVLMAKKGIFNVAPTAAEIEQVKKLNIEGEKENFINMAQAKESAVTLDGHKIDVFANIGNISECEQALQNGAEGVGLLRSEFLFLDRTTAPSEAEQTQQYQKIIASFNQGSKKDVIIRTLDVGGDKPLSYLKLPHEENPFLGVRGLRLSLKYPDIFRSQIKSLLQVKPLSSLKIMFPMVTSLNEIFAAKKIVQDEAHKLNVTLPQMGIMIEVPSAALLADVLAPHVDFFSIGSNDLTQYTLAIDRGHKDLASAADGLHPSVLQLIKITCDAAKKHKKMVGVCGGIAGDLQAVPLLIGLGVNELSVSVPAIAQIKSVIRKLNFLECEKLALETLKLSDAVSVRKLVDQVLLERV
ncbi:MAG: phosphoenolpyruvate--protein phosphotransferase [Moraxellaceae bacterium]|nr:phosphoenolpyruvate--protein phosphotransferase [Pseudobdellovibrionaceae bacterium]